MNNKKILVFDLGGSSIKYSIDQLQTLQVQSYDCINKLKILTFISTLANQQQADEICVSAPGIIDSITGRIWGYSAIQDWSEINFFEELRPLLKNQVTKIYIDNDGNCALLGCVHELHKPVSSALSIVIGTGIGAAYYSDGKINKGHSNSMCELGMMRSAYSNKNNMSTELSTNALCNLVNQQLQTNYNGIQIFEEFDKQNKQVLSLVHIWINKNATFIYNMIWAFDPQYIFIGGAISTNQTFKQLLCQGVDEIFNEIKMINHTELVFAEGGNKLNLFGALLLSDSYSK